MTDANMEKLSYEQARILGSTAHFYSSIASACISFTIPICLTVHQFLILLIVVDILLLQYVWSGWCGYQYGAAESESTALCRPDLVEPKSGGHVTVTIR